MIYCNLKEVRKDSAVYDVGTSVNDITGQVVFYKESHEPEIIKQPKTENIRPHAIARIFGKYRKDFADDNFKEKLIYYFVVNWN